MLAENRNPIIRRHHPNITARNTKSKLRKGVEIHGRTLRILGIAGSLRKQSFNRSALRAAQQLAPSGAEDVFVIIRNENPFEFCSWHQSPPMIAA